MRVRTSTQGFTVPDLPLTHEITRADRFDFGVETDYKVAHRVLLRIVLHPDLVDGYCKN